MGEDPYNRRPHPGISPTPNSSHRLPPAVVTFDPTYPETQHERRGIGRLSEDDAFEQNNRHSVDSAAGEGGRGELEGHEEEDEVAFESVDLEDESGLGAPGSLSPTNTRNHRSSPFSVGLTPTGHTLQRSSFAYGTNGTATGNGRTSGDGSSSVGSPSARRPVSEDGHNQSSTSYIPKNIFTRTFSSGSRRSGETSPAPHTGGRKTPNPDPISTNPSSSSPSDPTATANPISTPRIHAPPAIPHSLNPSVMAALTSNQYPTTAASSSPTTTPFPSRSSTSAFSLLKRNSLSLALGTGGQNRSRTKGAAGGGTREGKMDQVRSRTRMVHLPPKDKEEDEAHLERWKHMMEESRLSETKRQETLTRRRAEKEKHLAESVPIWESSILALSPREWKGLVRSDPKLGGLWFEGVPSHLRGRVWSGCIGNGLALSKESFRACAYRAKKAIDSGRFPADVMKHIEDDTIATLPTTKLYGKGGPMTDELRELLAAWYVSRVDEGMGYVRGVHLIAGMLLMNMNIAVAYICLRNLLDRPCLRAFYCGVEEETEAYYRIFDNLQADLFPKIYANCKTVDVRVPSTFFTTLFLHQIPFEAAVRVWDLILLEGDGQIFRIGLAILSILEPRLYFPDKKEIQSVFDGKNAAALAIVAREKERAKLKGVAYEAETDGVLTVFGVNEDAIFEALGNDGWKESRFDRLLTRELPE